MSDRVHYYSNPGSPLKACYKAKRDGKGRIYVEETGQYDDLYSYIQSFADSCDINVLIARFKAGDENALNQKLASFIDATNIPNNYAELLNMINDSTMLFDSLPSEIKKNFNNNVNEFIMSVGKEGFLEKCNVNNRLDKLEEKVNESENKKEE